MFRMIKRDESINWSIDNVIVNVLDRNNLIDILMLTKKEEVVRFACEETIIEIEDVASMKSSQFVINIQHM